MNTKPLPIAIALAASGTACIISIYQKVVFSVFVLRFALTALIFYIIGGVITMVLNYTLKTGKKELEEQEELEAESDTADSDEESSDKELDS